MGDMCYAHITEKFISFNPFQFMKSAALLTRLEPMYSELLTLDVLVSHILNSKIRILRNVQTVVATIIRSISIPEKASFHFAFSPLSITNQD